MKNLLLTCLIAFSTSLYSQDYSGTNTNHTLDSKIFGKERKFDVYTPFAYQESKADSVMVIYIFDGQFDAFFDMAVNTADYLHAIGELSNFIAVGIHTENRPSEFTPEPTNPKTREAWGTENEIGNANLLEDHLENEIMPFIEANYRTTPLRLGIGHSLGGTFVSNCIFENNDLFKAVISISPNTQYDNNQLVFDLDTLLKNNQAPNAFHFMTAGTVGSMENSFRRASNKVDSVYRAHPAENLKWDFRTYEDLNHSLTPMRSISEGLVRFGQLMTISDGKALGFLENTKLTYAEQLKGHFSELSEWLGYEVKPSSDEINGLGYLAGYEENWKAALGVFDWALELYPEDPNLNDSRGEALENLKDFEGAVKSYQRALDLARSQKATIDSETYEYYLEIFNINLERARGLLSEQGK